MCYFAHTYSATTTLHSLGIVPNCLPEICSSITRDTGPNPVESSPVGMMISLSRYPILLTGQIMAAVPKTKTSAFLYYGQREEKSLTGSKHLH